MADRDLELALRIVALVRGQKDVDTLNESVSDLKKSAATPAKDPARDIPAGMERATTATSGLTSALRQLAAVGLATQFVRANAALESFQTSMELVTGGSEVARAEIEFLNREIDRLGLANEAARQAFLSLTAATKDTALEGEQARQIFTAVSEAMAVLGKSSFDTQGALLAVEQIISKGTVSAEELRGQIGERLPGAFQLAADAMGVSTQELNKMLEQGQLLAADFLPAFAAQLQETFGRGGEQVETFVAQQARLRNAFDNLLVSLGNNTRAFDAISSAVGGAGSAINLANVGLQTLISLVQKAGVGIGFFAGALSEMDFAGFQDEVSRAFDEIDRNLQSSAAAIFDTDSNLRAAGDTAAEAGRKGAEAGQAIGTSWKEGVEVVGALDAGLVTAIDKLGQTKDEAQAVQGIFARLFEGGQFESGVAGIEQTRIAIEAMATEAGVAAEVISEGLTASLAELSGPQLLEFQQNAEAALQGLGEVGEQIAEQVTDAGDIARAAFVALGDTGVATAEGLDAAFSEALKNAGNTADIEALRNAIIDLGESGALSAGEVDLALQQVDARAAQIAESIPGALDATAKKSEELSAILDATLQASLRQLGVAAETGAQDAIAAFQALAGNARATAEQIDQGLVAVLTRVDTTTDLSLIRQALIDAGETGVLAGQQMDDALAKVDQRARELTATLDGPVAEAFQRMGIKSRAELNLLAEQAQRDFETIRNSGQATSAELEKAFNKYSNAAKAANNGIVPTAVEVQGAVLGIGEAVEETTTKFGGLGAAAAGELAMVQQQAASTTETFIRMAGVFGSAEVRARESFRGISEAASDFFTETERNINRTGTTFSDYFRGVNAATDITNQAIDEQRRNLERLTENIKTTSNVTDQQIRKWERAIDRLNLLNQAELSGVIAELEAMKRAVDDVEQAIG